MLGKENQMSVKAYIQGNIAGAMRRWDPIRLTPAKDYSSDKIWETIEQTGLKTKFYKNNKLVSTQNVNDAIEDYTLLLENIEDPFLTLRHNLILEFNKRT